MSENTLPHFTRVLEASGDTLPEARKKLGFLTPPGTILVMEMFVSGGESKITQTAPSREEANRLADRSLPAGAVVTVRNVNSTSKRAKVTVTAKNEALAVADGEKLAQEKLTTREVALVSTQMKEKGNPGLLGIGKQPNVYELEFVSYASITVKYRLPVTLRGLFAEEAKIAQEARRSLTDIQYITNLDESNTWLLYEAITQPGLDLTPYDLSLLQTLIGKHCRLNENRAQQGVWRNAAARVEKAITCLLERIKMDDPSEGQLISLLGAVDPTGVDKDIRQVCAARGHKWADDGSTLEKCQTKCARCGEKKSWANHQWSEAGGEGACKNCRRFAYVFSDHLYKPFCETCGKYVSTEKSGTSIYCKICHAHLGEEPETTNDSDDDWYAFSRTH